MVHLLNLRDQNLPPFKDARLKRINSTKKIISLIQTATRTIPIIPAGITSLDENDRRFD